MKITFEAGSYKLVAVRQRDVKVWLVSEFSGSDDLINVYGTRLKGLLRTIRSLLSS
jgi:hypothetical protein